MGYGRPDRANLKRTTTYRNGVRHGTATEYSESGELIADGDFQDGAMQEGTFLVPPDIEGQEPIIVRYRDGKQVHERTEDEEH